MAEALEFDCFMAMALEWADVVPFRAARKFSDELWKRHSGALFSCSGENVSWAFECNPGLFARGGRCFCRGERWNELKSGLDVEFYRKLSPGFRRAVFLLLDEVLTNEKVGHEN
jgi:hypothetical protein